MTIAYSIGDSLTVNVSYLDNYFSEITGSLLGSLTSIDQKKSVQILRYLGDEAITVADTGTVEAITGTQSFIRLVPYSSTNPVYKNGDGATVFFPDDETLNRSFADNMSGAIGGKITTSFLQTGYFSATTATSATMMGSGLFTNPLTLTTGAGSFSGDFDDFGKFVEGRTESSAGDVTGFSTELGETVCQMRHNPRLVLPVRFSDLDEIRFFIGFGETNATLDPFVAAAAPSLGQIGLRFDAAVDTNMQFVHQDGSGTLTSVDTGFAPTTSTAIQLEIDVSAGSGDASVLFTLRDESGYILAGTQATTNLPASTDDLFFLAAMEQDDDAQPEMRLYWGSLILRP